MKAVGIYRHLERSSVDETVRNLGERSLDEMMQKGDVIAPVFAANNAATERKKS